MKNLKISLMIMISSVLLLCAACSVEDSLEFHGEFMGIKVVSESGQQILKQHNEPVFEPVGAELLCDGNPVPYYKNRCTYLLPIDIESESWDDMNLSSGTGGKLYIVSDTEIKSENINISENEKFTLIHVKDGVISEYSLTFSGLPVMTVDTKQVPENIDNPIDEDDVDCLLTFYEATATNKDFVYQSSDAYIHHRGGSTIAYPKKGMRINLRYTNDEGELKKNHLSFCGMRTDDDWILIPLYTEDTKVREKFCIDTWEMFGLEQNDFDMDNGTRMEYIELIINGEYWGMFGLVEPIDGKQLNMSDGDVLVKIHSWNKPKASVLRTLGDTKLFIDYSAKLSEQETMDIKYPKKITQDSWDVMANFMQYVFESSTKEMITEMGDWIDIENAVDHWLFINFICAGDNDWKNLYISFMKDGDDYKIYLTPWDFDLTFGETWDGDAYLHWQYKPWVVSKIYNFEYSEKVLEGYEEAQKYCYERWFELRKDILDVDNMMNRIDNIQSFIISSGAYARDLEKWPNGGHTTDLEYLKNIITQRIEFLDGYISENYG